MKIQIVEASNGKQVAVLENLDESSSMKDIKDELHKKCPKYYPSRQSLRLEPRGKSIEDKLRLSDIDLSDNNKIYLKDLGPQLGWSTVFLMEYSGPLFIYLLFVPRPAFIYGAQAALKPRASVVWIAAGCWTFHFAKRILETLFVHRFSHGTMPIANLFKILHVYSSCLVFSIHQRAVLFTDIHFFFCVNFYVSWIMKNCSFYWGFAAFVSYYVNHPLYTPPAFGNLQVYIGLAAFLISVYGNFVSHCVFRDLRPAGSTVRRIPYPTSNPMSFMFNFVSCPNYTYETFTWLSFTVMTQTLPAAIFNLTGFLIMANWAQGKHRNYRKEFKDYPKSRKSIIPFLW